MNTSRDCESIQDALPWFVNGTLPEGQRPELRAHLESCEVCRKEAEWLAQLRREMPDRLENVTPDRDELAVEKLMSDVADSRGRRERRKILLAASVLLAMATLVGSMLTSYLLEPRFQAVTDTVTHSQAVQLQLQFAPEARIDSLRSVMERTGATVSAGPDARGWVVLEVPMDDFRDREDLLEHLRSDPQVTAVEVLATSSGNDAERNDQED